MSYQRVIGLLALAALMVGCGKESGNTNVISFRSGSQVTGDIALRKDGVALHVPGAPEALIDAAGDLSIDRQPATVNAVQRALLQDYYRNAQAIDEHDLATDMADAAATGHAIKSVVQDIASGNTGNIDKTTQAKSPQVAEAILKTCHDLAGIKAAQDGLAGQLAAFKPYAWIIEAGAIGGCEAMAARRG
ncbi:hypothetical protein [Rhodanobacter sp. DHB23]|uniref:hypothetical protein n=1 Tax=Rhodanobacter sp. DHB23 TaxID=2775923 RepID=UPI00177BFEC7|nr:hypothetical protein [Rhodanobacter sp. DHB23]MBD8873915.1 hypothetical protein [Rhodanobacter sp. DHB23]